ncbi:putative uncharacterized protein [Bacteroides sp. CAG:598]|nr:putative uncharacterized protein [Bacteroides sp. CAG:598]
MGKGKKDNFSSEMQERLSKLAKALGVSNREFSRRIGKSDNYIATMNIDITVGVANNIYTAFPQVNLLWLITGKGDILLKEPLTQELSDYLQTENKELKKENKELLLEVGRLQGIVSELKKENAHLVTPANNVDAGKFGVAE